MIRTTATVASVIYYLWNKRFIKKLMFSVTFFCSLFVLVPVGWEADQYSRGMPERSAEKAQRHLWEVRMDTARTLIHWNKQKSQHYFFLIVLTSTEKRRILKRRWTRKGKRKSMRPNPKTRIWQKSKCVFGNIRINKLFLFGLGCFNCLTTRCHRMLNI